jgi:hypothetical protein
MAELRDKIPTPSPFGILGLGRPLDLVARPED